MDILKVQMRWLTYLSTFIGITIFKNHHQLVLDIRRKVELLQRNPVEMIPYAKFIKTFRYILFVIDVFSKSIMVEPVKWKQGKHLTYWKKKFLYRVRKMPKYLQTENRKDFTIRISENRTRTIKLIISVHFSLWKNCR